jgi:exopolysaccharide biosynthesis protein
MEAELARSHRRRRVRIATLLVLFTAIGAVVAHHVTQGPRGVLPTLDHCSAIVDLRGSGYRVEPALARTERGETFAAMMARLKPHVAITGTFYDPDLKPQGDIVADGKLINRGFERQAIGFRRDGGICFLERHGSAKLRWNGCYAGVACGPRLVRSGKIDINVRRDGFGPSAATLKATRCAVGATADAKLVMLAIKEPVTLRTLARGMVELGAVDAVNMDGGGLCAFYSDGECGAEPALPINNVIAVYRMK